MDGEQSVEIPYGDGDKADMMSKGVRFDKGIYPFCLRFVQHLGECIISNSRCTAGNNAREQAVHSFAQGEESEFNLFQFKFSTRTFIYTPHLKSGLSVRVPPKRSHRKIRGVIYSKINQN